VIVSHDPGIASRVDRVVRIRDGRTSTETVRRAVETAEGDGSAEEKSAPGSSGTHEEFTVMDAAGRLQLPREMVEQLGLGRRVRVEMEDGQIVVRAAIAGSVAERGTVEAVGVASGEALTDMPGGKRRWWQRR